MTLAGIGFALAFFAAALFGWSPPAGLVMRGERAILWVLIISSALMFVGVILKFIDRGVQ